MAFGQGLSPRYRTTTRAGTQKTGHCGGPGNPQGCWHHRGGPFPRSQRRPPSRPAKKNDRVTTSRDSSSRPQPMVPIVASAIRIVRPLERPNRDSDPCPVYLWSSASAFWPWLSERPRSGSPGRSPGMDREVPLPGRHPPVSCPRSTSSGPRNRSERRSVRPSPD
jgi:hypothetical protein